MTAAAQAGWYPQPDGSQRYWDGHTWTTDVAPPAPAAFPPAARTLQPYGGSAVGAPVVAPKNPGLALLGSFFVPGLGQFINGNASMGVLMICLWLVSFPLLFVIIGIPMMFGVWIWSMVDAYTGAQTWNARHGIIS